MFGLSVWHKTTFHELKLLHLMGYKKGFHIQCVFCLFSPYGFFRALYTREKGRELTQSYDKSSYIYRKFKQETQVDLYPLSENQKQTAHSEKKTARLAGFQ